MPDASNNNQTREIHNFTRGSDEFHQVDRKSTNETNLTWIKLCNINSSDTFFYQQWWLFNCVFAISEGEFEHRVTCVCVFALLAGVPRLSEATFCEAAYKYW